jgi:FlaA1/EpsC-like NDP-sugar epimerase
VNRLGSALVDLLDRLLPGRAFVPRGRHLFVYDLAVTAIAVFIAFALRFDASNIVESISPYLPVALLPLVVRPPTYFAFGLYRREWRYASVNEMFAIAGAVLVGTGIAAFIFLVLAAAGAPGTPGYPRSIFGIEALVSLALVGGGRFALRAGLERRGLSGGTEEERGAVPTIVYGAGDTGATVARVAAADPDAGLAIVGYLDDEPRKSGSQLFGKRVFGGLDQLARAVRETGARQLLIAMPTASGPAIRRAFEQGLSLGLEVRTIPHPRELLSGELQLGKIRKVSVEDLLRREPVVIDTDAMASYLNGASVLVTGGGGSIGSELARQILELGPRMLTVLDSHEGSLWNIERELAERPLGTRGVELRAVLADIRSPAAIERAIGDARPEVVFHAAALKHVPIVELHPAEGVMTNVVGTRNTLAACEAHGVERFVLISTDKAVEPISAMGATKRLAELLTIAAAHRSGRAYAAVRFGNVLGSSGSVIPTFQHQLEEGRALTVTHPEATRYFMTVGEAVSLILEAGATAEAGELYVLDMGEPVRIVDLAHDLILLSGLDPERVPIEYTGLRPGERLHETLFYREETTGEAVHPGIMRVRQGGPPFEDEMVVAMVDQLGEAARQRDEEACRQLLQQVLSLSGSSRGRRRARAALPVEQPNATDHPRATA